MADKEKEYVQVYGRAARPALEEPVYRFHSQPMRTTDNQVGAVIIFNCGAEERERAQAFLDNLAARGIIRMATARTYNSDHGTPDWYIP